LPRWKPVYTFLNVLEHYIDIDCFLVSVLDPGNWMRIHTAKRKVVDVDVAYWISTMDAYVGFNRENFERIARTRSAFVARHAGFSYLWAPVLERGQVKAAVILGPFADHELSDRELKQCWLNFPRRHDAAVDNDFNHYSRVLLDIPRIQGKTLSKFTSFVELFAEAVAGEGDIEVLDERMREIFYRDLTRAFYHVNWSERVIRQDRYFLDNWSNGLVRPWERAEMGITRIPERILAVMPSLEVARQPMDSKRLALRFQSETLKFVAAKEDVAAGQLGDYGAVLFHAPDPPGAEGPDAAFKMAREFRQFIHRRLGCGVYCGIGTREKMDRLYQSYVGAVSAVHRSAETGGWLMIYSEKTAPKDDYLSLAVAVERLVSALLLGRRDQRLSAVNDYIAMAKHLCGDRLEGLRSQFLTMIHLLLREAERQCRLEAPTSRNLASHWSLILEAPYHPNDLVEAFAACMEEAVSVLEKPGSGSRELRFLKAQKWIEANFHLDPPLSAVAREHGFSEIGFRRELRRVKGLTYSQWLSQLRLAKSKDLLANTALRSTAIAVSLGFPSISYFFQWFRRHAGMTPTQWRRKSVKGRP